MNNIKLSGPRTSHYVCFQNTKYNQRIMPQKGLNIQGFKIIWCDYAQFVAQFYNIYQHHNILVCNWFFSYPSHTHTHTKSKYSFPHLCTESN